VGSFAWNGDRVVLRESDPHVSMGVPMSTSAPGTNSRRERTPLLVALVALLGIGFAASYEAGLANPHPHHLRIGVVAPSTIVAQLRSAVARRTDAVAIEPVSSERAARRAITDRHLAGAVVLDTLPAEAGRAPGDTLLVTEVPSRVIGEAVEKAVRTVEGRLGRRYNVVTLNRFAPGDPLGLGVFYLAIALVVSAYLLAAMLAVTRRDPETVWAWARRLLVLALYSAGVGIASAIVVGPLLGVLDRHVAVIAGISVMLVFSVLMASTLIEVAFGPTYGTGIAIVLFVILGNPAAGGPFPRSMEPAFFRVIGGWLPTGFGTDAFRSVVYLGGDDLGTALSKMTLYAACGVVGTALILWQRERSDPGM
jgi:hypothetical protein